MKKGIVYGWGINDSPVPVSTIPEGSTKRVVCCHYGMWSRAVQRAKANETTNHKNLAKYLNTTISDDWKFFSDFKRWSESNGLNMNNRKYLELDKDILIRGNDNYGPLECSIVPRDLNLLLLGCDSNRGEYPVGVCRRKSGGYFGQLAVNGKGTYLGIFETPMLAHRAWQIGKASIIESKVVDYKNFVSFKDYLYRQDVADALLNRAQILRDDAANNRETIKL